MTSIFGYDFRYLWCAGKLAREGGNPYSVEPFRQCLNGIGWLCVALSQERGFRVRVADLIHADKTTPVHACVWIRCCDVASEPQLESFCGRCCWIGVSARSIVGIFPSRSELVLCSHGNTFQRSRVVAASNPRAPISSIDEFYGLASLPRDHR